MKVKITKDTPKIAKVITNRANITFKNVELRLFESLERNAEKMSPNEYLSSRGYLAQMMRNYHF